MKRFFQLSKLMMLLWVTALFAVSCDTDDGSDDKADELLGWYTDMLLTSESWFFDFSGLDMSRSSFSIFDEEGRLAPTDGYMSTYIPNINFIKVIDDHTLVAYEYGTIWKRDKGEGVKVYDLNGTAFTGPLSVYASAPYYIVYQRDGNYLIFNDADGHEIKMGISDNSLIFDGKRYSKIDPNYKDPVQNNQVTVTAITGNWYRHFSSWKGDGYIMITFNEDGTGRYVEYDKPFGGKLELSNESFTHVYNEGKLTFKWGENDTETAEVLIYDKDHLVFTDWPDKGTNGFSVLTDDIKKRIEDFRETAADYQNVTLSGLHAKPLGIYNEGMETGSFASIAASLRRDYKVSYADWGGGATLELVRDSNNVCINVKYHDLYFKKLFMFDGYLTRFFIYYFDVEKTKLPSITTNLSEILNDYQNMGLTMKYVSPGTYNCEENKRSYELVVTETDSLWDISIYHSISR